jgi:MFS family permease
LIGSLGSIASILAFVPFNIITTKCGPRNSILLGNLLVIIGFMVQSFLNVNFYFVLIGHFITHIGSVGMAIAKSKYLANWLTETRRVQIIAVNSFSIAIGLIIFNVLFNKIMHRANENELQVPESEL